VARLPWEVTTFRAIILSEAQDPLFFRSVGKQVVRFAQDDISKKLRVLTEAEWRGLPSAVTNPGDQRLLQVPG
jgi:hypothetical protein